MWSRSTLRPIEKQPVRIDDELVAGCPRPHRADGPAVSMRRSLSRPAGDIGDRRRRQPPSAAPGPSGSPDRSLESRAGSHAGYDRLHAAGCCPRVAAPEKRSIFGGSCGRRGVGTISLAQAAPPIGRRRLPEPAVWAPVMGQSRRGPAGCGAGGKVAVVGGRLFGDRSGGLRHGSQDLVQLGRRDHNPAADRSCPGRKAQALENIETN